MAEHWAENSDHPVAARARRIILAAYDGAPPWMSPIPHHEWDDAVRRARSELEESARG